MQELAFDIDPELIKYIKERKKDYRVCTTCGGAVILPVDFKKPKSTDIRIDIDGNTLYVSEFQAKFIKKLTKDMLYDVEV